METGKTGHQVYLKLHLIILRCSRPLCSSQTTTPSHPSTHRVFTAERFRPAQEQPETTRNPCPSNHVLGSNSSVLLSQDPTVCQTVKPGTWIPGSNSNPSTPTVPPKGNNRQETAYSAARTNPGNLPIDVPPLSTHRKTYVSDMGISCKAHIQHCGRT